MHKTRASWEKPSWIRPANFWLDHQKHKQALAINSTTQSSGEMVGFIQLFSTQFLQDFHLQGKGLCPGCAGVVNSG